MISIEYQKTARTWEPVEEGILLETVLDYIATNKSRTQAFEDVASALDNRSASAVQYHWNSVLRPKNKDLVEEAMRKRQEHKRVNKEKRIASPEEMASIVPVVREEPEITTSPVKTARTIYEGLVGTLDEILEMHVAKDVLIDSLRKENDFLLAENARLKRENEVLLKTNDELREFARVIEMARKLVVDGEVAVTSK